MRSDPKIVIIGAGFSGLCAGYGHDARPSRGRFGASPYVDNVLEGEPETVWMPRGE